MSIPDFQTLMLPLLRFAGDGREHSVAEARSSIAFNFELTAEVNRPTFAPLKPPLAEICRYIGIATLREEIQKVEHVLQYLKPEFLEGLSEKCELGVE